MVNNKKSTKLVKQHELYKYGELVLVIHNDVITPGRIHQLFSVTVRARATVRKLTEETLMTSQTEEKQQFMYHIYVYGLAESKESNGMTIETNANIVEKYPEQIYPFARNYRKVLGRCNPKVRSSFDLLFSNLYIDWSDTEPIKAHHPITSLLVDSRYLLSNCSIYPFVRDVLNIQEIKWDTKDCDVTKSTAGSLSSEVNKIVASVRAGKGWNKGGLSNKQSYGRANKLLSGLVYETVPSKKKQVLSLYSSVQKNLVRSGYGAMSESYIKFIEGLKMGLVKECAASAGKNVLEKKKTEKQ